MTMLNKVLEHYGWLEVFMRIFLAKHSGVKKIVKNILHNNSNKITYEFKENEWLEYKSIVLKLVGEGEVVLIHSSMDGLAKLGVNENHVIELLNELVSNNNTVVLPAFPITNVKKTNKPYDPKKTLCWTGMLPNLFIRQKDVVRSAFPYNSLASLGPKSHDIIDSSDTDDLVYGVNSAWQRCVELDAKILFLGTTAARANTMAIHMPPDLMAERWPIDDWYSERKYNVRLNNEVVEKTVRVQKGKWYKYCMENKTSKRLKENNLLSEQLLYGCYLGFVPSSKKMLSFLLKICKMDKLMYLIPKKYYKNNI